MEIAVRGNVLVAAKVENLGDVLNCARGLFGPELIKSVQLSGVLVAPKTSCFALPARFVKQLKLQRLGTRKARTATGFAFFGIYEPVRLSVLDRDCTVDVIKVPDACPVLLGRLPLLLLDLIIDETNGRLTGNPDHDGHPMIDLS
jgi:hypothetical protein